MELLAVHTFFKQTKKERNNTTTATEKTQLEELLYT